MSKKTITLTILAIFLISILSTFVLSYAGEYNSSLSRHPPGTYTYELLQRDKEIYNAYRFLYGQPTGQGFWNILLYQRDSSDSRLQYDGYYDKGCISENKRLFQRWASQNPYGPTLPNTIARCDYYCKASVSCHGARPGERAGCNLGQVCSNNCTCIWKDQDLDTYPIEQDCDDQDSRTYPNAEELCDSKDNDCDGTIDEGVCLRKVYVCDTDNFISSLTQSQESCQNQEYCSIITNERTTSCSYLTQSTDLGINDFFVFICDAFFEDGYQGCERFTKGFFHVCEPYETSCNDNIDNDCDGKTDSQDEECTCTSDQDCISQNPAIGQGRCINGHCNYNPINNTTYCSQGQCNLVLKAWCDTSTSPYSWNNSIEYCTYCNDPEYCSTISPSCISNLVCYPPIIDPTCYYHQTCNPTQCIKDDPSCPSSCQNNAIRPCPFQYGVCLGSQQTCINEQWPGCDYTEITGYSPNEICGDFLDNNCNGLVDENCVCTENETIQCGSNIGSCSYGHQTCINGRWSQTCTDERRPSLEICDNRDNDCDGAIDEGCTCTSGQTRSCGSSQCGLGTQTCINGNWGSCVGLILPSSEICDNIDNDCDGAIDENCACTSGQSRSCGSSIGTCSPGTQECLDGLWSNCLNPILPTTEVCDDNLDNDCDGTTDEGCACTEGGERDCELIDGVCENTTQTCINEEWSTCDYPDDYEEEEESCSDDLDNDCDDLIDDLDEDCSPLTTTCEDGTSSSECSTEKPLFCSSGILEERCALCGCSDSLICKSDGTCGSPSIITRCGDGICEGGETCISCPSDCGKCSDRPGGDTYTPLEEPIEEEGFPWWILILVLIILLIFGTLGYLYYTQNPYLIKYLPFLKKKPRTTTKSFLDKIKDLFKKKQPIKPSTPSYLQKPIIPFIKRPIIKPSIRKPLSESAFNRLKEYIRINLDKGYTYTDIKEVLLKANWKREDIERAYREVK